ncbi:MAG: hypothetical protein Q4C03_01840 [bacterium]|nr:hypothetical protein [bacterium]
MITNEEKQNQLTAAMGAQSVYGVAPSGTWEPAPSTLARLESDGALLADETVSNAAKVVYETTRRLAKDGTWLGLLCLRKKAFLDARGNYANEQDRGAGFESWTKTILAGTMSQRHLRSYMSVARAFLADLESAFDGNVGALSDEQLQEILGAWAGDKTLAQIKREIEKEAARKEIEAAMPDADEEDKEAALRQQNAAANLMLKLEQILRNARKRDEEHKVLFGEVVKEMNNEETQRYVEALAMHYRGLSAYYENLSLKAKAVEAEIQS